LAHSFTPSAPPSLSGVEFLSSEETAASGPNFNAYNAPTFKLPRLRALCSSAEGVAETIKWARDENIPFAVRSTGHDFAGHSQHESLVIDTSPLNGIELNGTGGTVRVGAGARNGAVSIALAEAGQILGGGTHESVGMAGVTLGGGFGYFTRLAGLLCDQLQSLTLVDASGRIVTVDQQVEPDLFWACKGGGGGSLGIVTDLTYRTLEASHLTYVSAPLIVDAITAAHLLHDWQHWVADLPRTMTMHLTVSWYVNGQFLLNLSGMSLETAQSTKDKLHQWVGNSVSIADQWVQNRSAAEIMGELYGVPHYVSALQFLGRSQTIKDPLSLGNIALLLHTLGSYPTGAVNLNFEALGGAMGDISTDATAFPHRDASYIVHATKTVLDETTRSSSEQALQAVMASLESHASGGIYVNYPEADLENWSSAYWGENLPRLQAIKRQIDPDDLFHHAQSIPL
jgi:FAD/FMN-containing dehydrogenase